MDAHISKRESHRACLGLRANGEPGLKTNRTGVLNLISRYHRHGLSELLTFVLRERTSCSGYWRV